MSNKRKNLLFGDKKKLIQLNNKSHRGITTLDEQITSPTLSHGYGVTCCRRKNPYNKTKCCFNQRSAIL